MTERTASRIGFALGLVLFATMAGTLIELFLLEHTEGFWQQVPVGLSMAGIVLLLVSAFVRSAFARWTMRLAMLLACASGVVGTWQHYHGNVEFELEMYPTLEGFALFREAMTGATPVLAPGVMLTIGALGLVWSFLPRKRG